MLLPKLFESHVIQMHLRGLELHVNGLPQKWILITLLSSCPSVLMLDEAHERTLYTDIAIGLLKKVTLHLCHGIARFDFIATYKRKTLQAVHKALSPSAL